MADYRSTSEPGIVQRAIDGAWITVESDNADSLAYRTWLAAGNAPDPVDQPALVDLIKARRADVDDLLLVKSGAGVTIANVPAPVQVRDGDRANIDGQALFASLAKSGLLQWPPDSAWRLADNNAFAIPTADAMIGFAAAIAGAYLALRKASWTHKDALAALKTADDVAAYDITKGW